MYVLKSFCLQNNSARARKWGWITFTAAYLKKKKLLAKNQQYTTVYINGNFALVPQKLSCGVNSDVYFFKSHKLRKKICKQTNDRINPRRCHVTLWFHLFGGEVDRCCFVFKIASPFCTTNERCGAEHNGEQRFVIFTVLVFLSLSLSSF